MNKEKIMSIRALVLTLAFVSFAGAAWAGNTNISPANMSSAAPAAEAKSRPAASERAKAAAQREPGFWDREAKRSGLAQTGEGWGSNVRKLFHIPQYFKDQEAAYNQRNPGTDN